MQIKKLQDDTGPFEVSFSQGEKSNPVVLFAAGAGGLPQRYTTLLETLTKAGYSLIAPHFEHLASARPTEEELTSRARRLSLALDELSEADTKIVAVGHSIGASILLTLAGAKMWLGPDHQVAISADQRISKLAMLAPPSGFFRAPGALDQLSIPLKIRVGSEDSVTPPAQCQWLVELLENQNEVNFDICEGAGHFSFMDQMPPHIVEPLSDKAGFLRSLSKAIKDFLIS